MQHSGKLLEKNRWSPSVSEDISLSETLLFSKARTNNAEDIYNLQKIINLEFGKTLTKNLRKVKYVP